MTDDLPVEHLVDLDQAAAQISSRRPQWTATGLVVGPLTWRDRAAAWPQQLEQSRAQVEDPDSVGVHVTGPGDSELLVVVFRGGWADVDFLASLAEEVVSEAPDVSSARSFGELLDGYVSRAFGQAPALSCRRRTISEIQVGANGEVHPGEVG
ncbi:hypothetical protein [Streptomyces sp. NPDC088360]|uniref:hypothetical protein n=1 Tax=Streptomyces sp. NPDC088360 TaxID=3154515 RepID=UPI00344B9FC0